ncbi:universal stress protein, partial [Actinomadura sp. NPDC048032]|uniref:universal stress protein n=1 Tax=Actinomadura sp. NPDC048032 TaxID=3155747 RepID=UPI0033C64B2A
MDADSAPALGGRSPGAASGPRARVIGWDVVISPSSSSVDRLRLVVRGLVLVLVRSPAVGHRVAGQGEEDVVEARLGHREVVEGDPGVGQRGDRPRRLLGVADPHRQPVRIGVRARLHGQFAGEHLRRQGALPGILEPQLQRAGADLGLQLPGRVLRDDPAVVQDRDPVGEPVGLVEVLRREQHGRAPGDQGADDVPHLVARPGVESVILGSVSTRVLHHAHRPVLVVP